MAVIGIELAPDQLVVTKGRDFKWSFENLDDSGAPIAFPDGDLFFEFSNGDAWHFVIDDTVASIKVESVDVDAVPNRTKWQLVFLATGEVAGGDPIARGQLKVQI